MMNNPFINILMIITTKSRLINRVVKKKSIQSSKKRKILKCKILVFAISQSLNRPILQKSMEMESNIAFGSVEYKKTATNKNLDNLLTKLTLR